MGRPINIELCNEQAELFSVWQLLYNATSINWQYPCWSPWSRGWMSYCMQKWTWHQTVNWWSKGTDIHEELENCRWYQEFHNPKLYIWNWVLSRPWACRTYLSTERTSSIGSQFSNVSAPQKFQSKKDRVSTCSGATATCVIWWRQVANKARLYDWQHLIFYYPKETCKNCEKFCLKICHFVFHSEQSLIFTSFLFNSSVGQMRINH